jgi:hypothetical protein
MVNMTPHQVRFDNKSQWKLDPPLAPRIGAGIRRYSSIFTVIILLSGCKIINPIIIAILFIYTKYAQNTFGEVFPLDSNT